MRNYIDVKDLEV